MLATFSVVNTGDIRDPDDGTFETVPGSLRDALEQANEFDDFDTIVFTGFVFEQQTSISLFGQIDITGPVNIIGPGASKLDIITAPGRRMFLVDGGSDETSAAVTISGVTMTGNGSIPGDDEEGRGGVILNRGGLTLNQVELGGGSAPNGGGGIFNELGSLQVNRSLIVDNTSGQGGGGIQNGLADATDNLPSTSIVSSTITGNTAQGAPGEMGAQTGYGGGVLNFAGVVNIEQSTLYGNSAYFDGGGLASQGFDPMIDSESGAATVYAGPATTNIRSSIIVGNLAAGAANDVGSIGMIEGDTSADPPSLPLPFDPQINSLGYNLFGVLTHPAMTSNPDVVLPPMGPGDVDGIDPTSVFIDNGDLENPVAVLGDYGGDTRVFMPDANKIDPELDVNLVIDRGDPDPANVNGLFDQRGRHFRRVDTPLPDGTIDIGAVEVQNGIFVVDSLLDESDGEFRTGDFTLREAIDFSEKNPDRDTIFFTQDLRILPDPNPFTPAPTIVLSLGELLITKGVDVRGPTFQLEIDANSSSRIFNITNFDSSSSIDVSISDLTISNGGGAISGGAIFNNEDLTLNRMYLINSFAAFNGGALFVLEGDVVVDSSTFFNNSAANNGGAIYVEPTAGTVEIINSTLSANNSSNRGAGLANVGSNTSVKHSTITLNNAASTRGSGIANLKLPDAAMPGMFFTGELAIYSSIIAGNVNNDIEFFGGLATDITSNGYNLTANGNAIIAGVFDGVTDNKMVFDPLLAPLAFTGGPTPTHRIEPDENSFHPALDAGELGAAGLPMFDQRGEPQFLRVFDGDLDLTAVIDIGAYELQEVTYTVSSSADENDGDVSDGNLSLREAIEIANASVSPLPEKIVFDAMLVPGGSTISLDAFLPGVFTTPDIKITGPVIIEGPGITISGGGLFDGVSTFPMFTVDDGDDLNMSAVTFEGLTFVNGLNRAIVSREDVTLNNMLATNNTGVVDHSQGTLTINTSILTGNSSPNGGGAVAVTDGNLVVAGATSGYGYTLFTGNSTYATQGNGGGISFSDGTADGKTLSVNKVIISGNRVPAGAADGGGIFISGNGSAVAGNMTQASIQDSVISGNSTTGSNSEGAGIFTNNADVTLTGTIVSLNKSFGTNSKGAGIYVNGGSLTIENSADTNSLVTQNSTYGNYASGGGIANVGGDVVLNLTTISRNTVSGAGTHGAGIFSSGGNLTLNGSLVRDNSSTVPGFNGGGIYSLTNLTGTQKTSIFNSTVSGNTSTLRGGGVYNAGGLLEITYSTISDNSIPYFGNGGGVASLGNSGTTRTEVRSSIIAGNHSTNDPVNPNSDAEVVNGLTNSFVSLGYNVIGLSLPLALSAFNQVGDQPNIVDPGLDLLATGGGAPTATHALKTSSPAINAGDPSAVAGVGNVPLFDQRGTGFTRVDRGRIDVGAYESNLTPTLSATAADFDGDNDTDGADFLAWQRGFGITIGASSSDGDADNNGAVNGDDLAIWETDYGTGIAVPLAALSGVGESPSALSATISVASEPLAVETVRTSNRELTGLTLDSIVVSGGTVVAEFESDNDLETTVASKDYLFAQASLQATSSGYEDMNADLQAARSQSDVELEFSLEDHIFDLLGAEA